MRGARETGDGSLFDEGAHDLRIAVAPLGLHWQRIRHRVGLDRVRTHDLRHSCAIRPKIYEISSDFRHRISIAFFCKFINLQ